MPNYVLFVDKPSPPSRIRISRNVVKISGHLGIEQFFQQSICKQSPVSNQGFLRKGSIHLDSSPPTGHVQGEMVL